MSAKGQVYGLMLLGITTLLVLLTAIGWQFSQVQSLELEQQRNQFLLQSLRKTAEDALATGMTPEHMPAMQGVIDREKASFPQLTAIDIFSPTGIISYSTDIGALGTQVPAEWVEQLHQPGSWTPKDSAQHQLGMRFDSDLGLAAGGIMLTLQAHEGSKTLTQWQQLGKRVLLWLSVLCGGCLMAWGLTQWALRASLRPYRHITTILNLSSSGKEPHVQVASDLERQAHLTAQELAQEYMHTQERMQKLRILDNAQ